MWIVENIDGDGLSVKKGFETYEGAKAYSEWTLGLIRYVVDSEN
nr:MAG TPA: hypothetical protein [Caudoviricetes sp.]